MEKKEKAAKPVEAVEAVVDVEPVESVELAEPVEQVEPAELAETVEPKQVAAPAKKVTQVSKQGSVPVLADEDGDPIPVNSLIRLATVNGRNLRSPDGLMITGAGTSEVNGFDIREGDWYTVQFAAGLLRVDSYKKIR